MSMETSIILAVCLPLTGAVLIAFLGSYPNLRETVTLITATTLFGAVLSLLDPVQSGIRPEITFPEMIAGIPIRFEVEPLGVLFACIASGLWIVTSVYAIGYMRGHNELNQTRFYVFFAIAISATMGLAFAGNLLTLFIFYEILTLSTFPLVTHAGTDAARRGGRVYLGILIGTSILFLLPAIIWTWSLTGTLDFIPGGILEGTADPKALGVLLILFAFGIGKAALMPFHRWLPAAMVAPTPVSALLHAVAVVKAGVFSVLKIVVYVFGIDLVANLDASHFLMYVAAATIMIASLVAMRQDNLKRRLAYSTISQLSYIVLAAMLATELSVIGGGMHVVMHAFGKITLFFCAGAIMVATHKTEISQMNGIGRIMPFTMGAFFIGSLSIIGLPPFGGVWSKWYIAMGALDAHQIAMVAVLMISSLLNVAYLLPLPIRGFFGNPEAAHDSNAPRSWKGIKEAPVFCVTAQTITAAGCVVLFFWPDPVFRLMSQLFIH
ncbi:MAG: monovalent cation/H+ antiporter subunit D family protein [Rhodospirillales bacterium]|nr:monovalent cation/H+ antiporter subunit D family protein [Rhodospirillales bacterium]